VTMGLAICLTFSVMYPTMNEAFRQMDKVVRSAQGTITDKTRAEALNAGVLQWKSFLVHHAEADEVHKFSELADRLNRRESLPGAEENSFDDAQPSNIPNQLSDISWQVAAPAYFVSELKRAFRIGLSLLMPFILIELLTATVLVAVGLDQLSPTFVSLPFKLLVFVAVDGWTLITTNLVSSYAA
jgi:flagellar biosynthesis protein FliP